MNGVHLPSISPAGIVTAKHARTGSTVYYLGKKSTPRLKNAVAGCVVSLLVALVLLASGTKGHLRLAQSVVSLVAQPFEFCFGVISSPQLDYYARPGVLQLDKSLSLTQRARFVQLEALDRLQNTNSTGLGAKFFLGDGYDELQKYSLAAKGVKGVLKELDYLKGKTILIVGDSVDRNFLEFFCNQLTPGGSLTYDNLHEAPHNLRQIRNIRQDEKRKAFEPQRCRLPAPFHSDIWYLMLNGVTSENGDWQHKAQAKTPVNFARKLAAFERPFTQLGLEPDFIFLHTIAWDLATFNIRDARAGVPASSILGLREITHFRNRTETLCQDIRRYWPDAKLFYRTMHGVRKARGRWFLKGLHGFPVIERAPFSATKIAQLNQVISELVATSTSRLRLFDMHHSLQDFVQDFEDYIHPGEIGKLIQAQMLLYYLKEA